MPEVSPPSPAFVYLLRCGDGSLYCGWSTDVDRRVAAHQRGTASRYTASRRPVELAAAWRTGSRRDARRLEVRVKRLTRAEKLRLVAGAPLDGAEPLTARDTAPPASAATGPGRL
jgi:putative endonuclease